MDWVHDRYLYLPINPRVTKGDVKYVCDKIRLFYKNKNQVANVTNATRGGTI